jgi:hypothetical protein
MMDCTIMPECHSEELGRQDVTDIALKLRLSMGQDFDQFVLEYTF